MITRKVEEVGGLTGSAGIRRGVGFWKKSKNACHGRGQTHRQESRGAVVTASGATPKSVHLKDRDKKGWERQNKND